MNKDITVYCVDDDVVIRHLLESILVTYNCTTFESAQACLEAVEENIPDLILLDVIMPEMDGLEICKKLRENPELDQTSIIFISVNDSLDERLKGYTAGGDDYIVKPFKPDELYAKVKASVKRKENILSVQHEADDARSTAFNIMTAMSEMSSVVHFLQGTFNCNSYEALAKKIIQAHASLSLDISIEFNIGEDKKLYFCSGNVENALEESVFEYVRHKGRLVNTGKRAAVNYPNICILIRNMPTNNPDLYGRIRDHIAIIAQGADSKINSLKSDLIIKSQHDDFIHIMHQLKKTINEIESDYTLQQEFSETILSTLASTFEDSFISLGLTDEQEIFQRNIIASAETQIQELYDKGLSLNSRFASILELIENSQHNSVISDNQDKNNNNIEEEIEDDPITLF